MKELSANETLAVAGGLPVAGGLIDAVEGALVDGSLGLFYGALVGGANAGAAGSGGVIGVGAIAQGVGAIAGGIFGGLTGFVLGATAGYSNSGEYIDGTLDSWQKGGGLPKKGLA
ncbi:hypothetical protein R84981_000706 [Carnimonas sp. R-84981]|uniref:hypothetical protein n=1 Tax=Carnimonas bestiolae TaxID=3402172 RepID=UPI003EDBD513